MTRVRYSEGKVFGCPSDTVSVKNGDLVRVCYLPVSMAHFDKITGVVCNKTGKEFFIREIDSSGREIKDSEIGWYNPENVTVLVHGYKTVQYKPLPDNL